jgi:cell wall-associated NlpC family hydrolase
MDNIQSILNNLASQCDHRTSVFDLEIIRLRNTSLTLSGRLLNKTQLKTLSRHLPTWKLDTDSIRILHRENLPRMHVITNLTGLYEKPTFDMALSSELYFGTELEVLEEEEKWVFTRQRDGYLGWVYRSYLGEGLAPKTTHLVLAPSVELRARPIETSEITTRLVSGTGVTHQEAFDGWSGVSANKTGWLSSSSLRALNEFPETIEEKRKVLSEDSIRMIGVPYLWGGISGNGIDCSGFTRLLHRWVGVDIPRDADMQHAAAKPVEPPFEVGDLLFFAERGSDRRITHVGVSLGGWKMIHASRRNNGVYIDNVQEHETLQQIYVSAGSFLR